MKLFTQKLRDVDSVSAVLVKPTEDFAQWAESTAREDDDFTVEEVFNDDFNSYLIPEMPSRDFAMDFLERNYLELFKNELMEWSADTSDWPELTYENFKKFFEISFSAIVYTLPEGQTRR